MKDIWFFEKGCKHRRRGKKVVCKKCGKEFICRQNRNRLFCSNKCSASSRENRVKVKCYNCGKEVERRISNLRKSKHNVHFCSKKCKDFAQSLKGNCAKIRPDHYGSLNSLYRNLIKNTKNPQCTDCNEKRRYVLTVHHKDGDRKNNKIGNLEIVCASCHMKRHLKRIEEGWMYLSSYLTDRCLLDSL